MFGYNFFSEKQRLERGDYPDVYQYDEIPKPLREQMRQLLLAYSKDPGFGPSFGIWDATRSALRYQYGLDRLSSRRRISVEEEVGDFLLHTPDIARVLDVVVVFFQASRKEGRLNGREVRFLWAEINKRFREHGVGYQLMDNEIMFARVDSEYIHQEAVIPTLILFSDKDYANAEQEFLSAHEHFKKGEYDDAITDGCRSFESTLKIICEKRGWSYNKTDTAKKLVQTVVDNELVPGFWQNHIQSLKTILETAIPSPRNKIAAHGQGVEENTAGEHEASFVMHLTASTILFLINAEKNLPS